MPHKHKYLKDISRQHPDKLKFLTAPMQLTTPLPVSVDLRDNMPPVYQQEALGSCTANALAAAYEYLTPKFMGSRLFLYYNERKIENTTDIDAGAVISDGVHALEKWGICSETELPYDVSKFAVEPSAQCYTDALKHRVLKAFNVHPDITSIKYKLSIGRPIVVGIRVFASFESAEVAKTGIVPMPKPGEECLGGHAVTLCFYDDAKQMWGLRNSWGPDWGDKGYFYLPYLYLLDSNLASDFWVLTKDTN